MWVPRFIHPTYRTSGSENPGFPSRKRTFLATPDPSLCPKWLKCTLLQKRPEKVKLSSAQACLLYDEKHSYLFHVIFILVVNLCYSTLQFCSETDLKMKSESLRN